MGGFDPERLERLPNVMASHADRDSVGGVGWLAGRGEEIEVGVAGVMTRGEQRCVRRDTIFRISSMTKPIVAVAPSSS